MHWAVCTTVILDYICLYSAAKMTRYQSDSGVLHSAGPLYGGVYTHDNGLSVIGKERKGKFNMQFKSGFNQLNLSQKSNKKDEKRKQNKKTDEQLSPKMVIKSERASLEDEGDYGWKDLW